MEEKDREIEDLLEDRRAEDDERRPEDERKRRALEDLEFRVHELEAQLKDRTEEWERAVQECVELKVRFVFTLLFVNLNDGSVKMIIK